MIFEVPKVSVSCLTMTRLLTQCLTKYESFHVSMELNYDNEYKYINVTKVVKNMLLSNESFVALCLTTSSSSCQEKVRLRRPPRT